MARIQQSSLVSRAGQGWQPTRDKADEYLLHCGEICRLVPQNFDESSLPLSVPDFAISRIQLPQNPARSSCRSNVLFKPQICYTTRECPVGDHEETLRFRVSNPTRSALRSYYQ